MSVALGVVAGEISGDALGGDLLDRMLKLDSGLRFCGLGGERMQRPQLEELGDMYLLATNGIVEPLRRLPKLLALRRTLADTFIERQVQGFIGIDAPDFNLGLAERVHAKGIKCVHYVSPQIWAWRPNRIHQIARSVDLMLCLFPFELDIYKKHGVNAALVGHPLARVIPKKRDQQGARERLELSDGPWLAVLPGSRTSELQRHLPLLSSTLRLLAKRQPELGFLVPVAKAEQSENVRALLAESLPDPGKLKLFERRSQDILTAADAALVASGTATLEALLCGVPHASFYRLHPISWFVMKNLAASGMKSYTLPNILAGERIVEEYIQSDATPANLAEVAGRLLQGDNQIMRARFSEIHEQIAAPPANAVAELTLSCLRSA